MYCRVAPYCPPHPPYDTLENTAVTVVKYYITLKNTTQICSKPIFTTHSTSIWEILLLKKYSIKSDNTSDNAFLSFEHF